MGTIQEALIHGIRMTGGHQTVFEAEIFMQHLDHRRQTVGSAGGVGDDPVAGRVEVPMIDPIDKGGVELFPGRPQDDSFRPGPQMPFIRSPVPKGPG